MTFGNKKKAALQCCCRCIGHCWPHTCDHEVCTLESVPWEISAPNCTAINGTSGVFEPLAGAGDIVREMGPCGPCTCYESIAEINLPARVYFEAGGGPPPSPPPFCSVADTFVKLQFYIFTGNNEAGNCCNIKLLVYLREGHGLELCSGETVDRDAVTCIPLVATPDPAFYRVFSPSACECLPGTTGFAATFDLSEIAFCCPLGDFSGVCAPNSKCAVFVDCSLTEATLTL